MFSGDNGPMGLFGAIASVANSFQLVPSGTATTGDSASTAPAASAAVPALPPATAPQPPQTGPLGGQAGVIAARQGATAVRDGYLGDLGALFTPVDGAPSLGDSLAAFAQSWRALAASPHDPALAGAVISQGDAFAGTVRGLSAGVEAMAARMGNDVTAGLADLNQTLTDIYHQNRAIATQAALNNPSDQEEARRGALVAKVVDMTGANVFPRENRAIALYTPSGQALLDGRPTRFTSTADTAPATADAVSADGRITDGRLGALLRLAADGSRATPPRTSDPAPDAEVIRKARSQLDTTATIALGRTKFKQPTTFADAFDMADTGASGELGFGFFIGTGRNDLAVNPALLSGDKSLKPAAIAPVVTSLATGGRQLAADGLTLTNANYGQFARQLSQNWAGLGNGASRDARVAEAANALVADRGQTGAPVDVQGEVAALSTVQDALGTTRRIGHSLVDLLRTLEPLAA